MNILIVTYASSLEGNANGDIFTPARELSRRGHTIHLISQKDSKPYQIVEGTGSISVIPLIPPLSYRLFMVTPILLFKIFKSIRSIRPDILIFDGDFNIPLICFLLCKIKIFNLPHLIILRETTLENIYSYLTQNPFLRFVSWILYKVNYFIFNKTRYLLAIAPIIHEFYKDALKRDDLKSINLLCLDVDEFKPDQVAREEFREKYNVKGSEIIILYSGAMQPYRRVDLLINAFSHLRMEHNDIKLFISGRGISKTELVKQVQSMDLFDSVIFLDWLPREEIPKLISMADICVDPYPRKAMTPSGKLLEWMACGKCVVVARNASNLSWLKDGYNGIIFDSEDEQDLDNKLRFLLTKRNMIRQLGQNARSSILVDYDVTTVVPAFEELCYKVVSGHNSRYWDSRKEKWQQK